MYESITPETLKAQMLEKIDLWSKNEGTLLSDLMAAPAEAIWEWYMQLEAVPYILFPDEDSGFWIEMHCADYGIERKAGGKAKGSITFTGSNGLIIPAGKVFLTPSGLSFTLDEAVTITDGTGEGKLTASNVGTDYNLSAGQITVQQSALSGLTGWTSGETSGGYNEETDASLVSRYYERLQMPATSGNVYHYLQWAKEVSGVGAAKVYPLWNGAGTVKVVLAGDGYTVPSEEVVQKADEYIKSVAPIGADVTIVAGTEKTVTVTADVILKTGASLDTIKESFKESLADYLLSLAFSSDTAVVLTYVGRLLSETEGVKDYSSLKINGSASNLAIDETDIPTLGEVTISEAD